MLSSVIKQLKYCMTYFQNRKRFIFERLSQDSFSKILLGSTFRNSKWFNYLKVNINKLPLQNFKNTFAFIFVFFFVLLLALTLLENTTYGLLLNSFMQIKALVAVLLATLRVLPASILDIIIGLKDNLVDFWLSYRSKPSSKTFATRVRESSALIKSRLSSLTWKNNPSEVVSTTITPDSLQDQARRGIEVLLLLKRLYQLQETLRQLEHGDSVRSLKILARREQFGSYLTNASNADLKIIEMMLNVKRLELGMENDMKYKWELRNVTDVMLDSSYLPIQMCKEAGLDDVIIEILSSSEYADINITSDTSEYNSINRIVEDSTNLTKTQRVLSKNTILHNQSLKIMNGVTNTKKLVTDFASTFDATRNNIWIANNLVKNNNLTNFVENIKNLYGDYNASGKKNAEREVLRNYSQNNTSSNIDFIKYYEESFFWVVKQMAYLGSLDSELAKLSVQLNKVVDELDTSVLAYIYLLSKLNSVSMFLKDESLLDDVGEEFKQLARDTFYQSSNKELFTKEMLTSMGEIINGKSSADSKPYFFKLSDYDLLYDTESFPEVQDFATDWDATKKLIKKQLSPCPHMYDVVEREYVKDCYRLFFFIVKLIEWNNQNKKQ